MIILKKKRKMFVIAVKKILIKRISILINRIRIIITIHRNKALFKYNNKPGIRKFRFIKKDNDLVYFI